MIALLSQIVASIVCWIETAAITVVNILVYALGTLMAGFASLMPSIPPAPDLPAPMTTALHWIAWFFPVGTVVNIFTFMVVAWALWFALAIVLRWAKAINA